MPTRNKLLDLFVGAIAVCHLPTGHGESQAYTLVGENVSVGVQRATMKQFIGSTFRPSFVSSQWQGVGPGVFFHAQRKCRCCGCC